MNMSPRNVLIIAVAGCVLVAVAAVALLVVPQFSKIGDLNTEIQTAEQEQEQAQALLERRQQAKSRAAITDAELLVLANSVPESPELPSLIIELQDAAVDAGLQFRSLSPGPPERPWEPQGQQPAPEYLTIPITVEVFGTWTDTIDYLQRIQRFPRQVRIVSVQTQYTEQPPPQAPEPMPTVPVLTQIEIEAYMVPTAEYSQDASAPVAVQ
jgi:Tfp pilus assembly protein PilO